MIASRTFYVMGKLLPHILPVVHPVLLQIANHLKYMWCYQPEPAISEALLYQQLDFKLISVRLDISLSSRTPTHRLCTYMLYNTVCSLAHIRPFSRESRGYKF